MKVDRLSMMTHEWLSSNFVSNPSMTAQIFINKASTDDPNSRFVKILKFSLDESTVLVFGTSSVSCECEPSLSLELSMYGREKPSINFNRPEAVYSSKFRLSFRATKE